MASASICCSAVHLRYLVGLLAKGAEQSDGGRHQCGHKICPRPTVRKVLNGAHSRALTDIVAGIRRIKVAGRPGLLLWGSSTLTSTLLDMGWRMKSADVLSVLLGTGSASFAREPRHAHSNSSARKPCVRHHLQYLQGRRPLKTG